MKKILLGLISVCILFLNLLQVSAIESSKFNTIMNNFYSKLEKKFPESEDRISKIDEIVNKVDIILADTQSPLNANTLSALALLNTHLVEKKKEYQTYLSNESNESYISNILELDDAEEIETSVIKSPTIEGLTANGYSLEWDDAGYNSYLVWTFFENGTNGTKVVYTNEVDLSDYLKTGKNKVCIYGGEMESKSSCVDIIKAVDSSDPISMNPSITGLTADDFKISWIDVDYDYYSILIIHQDSTTTTMRSSTNTVDTTNKIKNGYNDVCIYGEDSQFTFACVNIYKSPDEQPVFRKSSVIEGLESNGTVINWDEAGYSEYLVWIFHEEGTSGTIKSHSNQFDTMNYVKAGNNKVCVYGGDMESKSSCVDIAIGESPIKNIPDGSSISGLKIVGNQVTWDNAGYNYYNFSIEHQREKTITREVFTNSFDANNYLRSGYNMVCVYGADVENTFFCRSVTIDEATKSEKPLVPSIN